MVYRLIILILLLLCSSCISKTEVATDLLIIADWAQTKQIAANPEKHSEANKILGEHPSTGRVNGYFISCLMLNTIVHRVLPEKYLRYYQFGLISMQVGVVAKNYSAGLNVKF